MRVCVRVVHSSLAALGGQEVRVLNHATWKPTVELAHPLTIEPAEGVDPRTSCPYSPANAPQWSRVRVWAT